MKLKFIAMPPRIYEVHRTIVHLFSDNYDIPVGYISTKGYIQFHPCHTAGTNLSEISQDEQEQINDFIETLKYNKFGLEFID